MTVLAAVELDHRSQMQRVMMENIALRQQVIDLGGIPVNKSGEEWLAMYRHCTRIIQAAHELVMFLGSGKEMLADWS